MKKTVICIVISILSVYFVHAQDVKFGVRGGLNLPNIVAGGKDTPVSEGYSSRLSHGWGIFTEWQVIPAFSLRLGVEYSGMGGKKEGLQALPSQRLISEIGSGLGFGVTEDQLKALGLLAVYMPQYYYADIKNTVKLNYVMIPLLAQYNLKFGKSAWGMYINGGPFVSFIVSGKQAAKGNSKLYFDASATGTLWDIVPDELEIAPGYSIKIKETITQQFPDVENMLGEAVEFGETDITGELRSANFGITGNIGIRCQIKRHCIFLEAGGNYGFISVQNNDENGKNRIGAASVMLGYAISIF